MTRALSSGGTFPLAAIAGGAIANNYALQPVLAEVAADLDVPLSVIGLVPAASSPSIHTAPATSAASTWSRTSPSAPSAPPRPPPSI
ncbi:hypothetical protein [Streptomyces sp. NPDC091217]|uniref:hypothetical protein n=1 Tax=Streptomyces sp. NPDC091217 TaxID=3365975 RepID=UPI0038035524